MRIERDDGFALVMAMLALLLMAALGIAVVLTTSGETIIAHNYRKSSEALYAADAGIERVMGDLSTMSDWDPLLSGSAQSSFVDGPASGTRTLVDGTRLDLAEVVNLATCDQTTPCSDAQIAAARPWGAANPRWRLYAYGNPGSLLPAGRATSAYYVIVLVADDPSEVDGNPLQDGATPCHGAAATQDDRTGAWSCNPGTGVVWLRSEAFGPGGAHKVVEVTVGRAERSERDGAATDAAVDGQSSQIQPGREDDVHSATGQPAVRIVSWREIR